MKKSKSKGVIIFALGSPYWGELAENLAMSIRFTSDVPITLLVGDSGANHLQRQHLFDKIERISDKCYTTQGRLAYVKAKTHAVELSPYTKTILLDADMIWLPKRPIDELFYDVDFTMANRSYRELDDPAMTPEFGVWIDPLSVKEAYKFKKGKFYNLSSEFILFKKTKEVRKLFKDAQKIFAKPKVYPKMLFQMGMPDELPFSISMIMNDLYPHRDNFLPFYWESAEGKQLEPALMHQSYYAYSMGGNMAGVGMKAFYDNLVKYYYSQAGQQFPPLWRDKIRAIPERSNV